MSRLVVFVTVVLTIVVGVHYYLWARLVRDPHLPTPWSGLATGALVLLAASMPAAMIVGRRAPGAGRVLAWPAFIWMGLMFLFLTTLVGVDAVRVVAVLARRASGIPSDPSRRTAIARLV